MKNVKNPQVTSTLIVGVIFMFYSCQITPELTDVTQTVQSKQTSNAIVGVGFPGNSFPISMDRVTLYFIKSASTSGTVTIRITNGTGSVVLASKTVLANSIVHDSWSTFYFPAVILNSGEKYRMDVIRSNVHNYVNDHISWRSSSTNVYTKGGSNFSTNDMSFITYSDGYVDQQQTIRNYGWAISNNYAIWQEFVPSKIWIIQP